jgi:hypothetical protein
MAPDAAKAERRPLALPLPLIALGVTAAVAALLLVFTQSDLSTKLGDTDDAMRLMMVRALMSGETGWFHPHLARLQPPLGLDMHWSRLADGGMAATIRLFELVMPPARAEIAMRLVWPLAWIFPAAWSALAIARRTGGPAALGPALALLLFNLLLYAQWQPGRIDHHNLQIVLSMAALAGAVTGGRRGGLVAGIATGLGMAVGLEALVFLAVAGASFAVRFVFAPDEEAPAGRAYAASLLASVSLFYLVQTPPPRLAASVCDALAANLWCAVAVAAVGLLAVVQATRARPLPLRLAALGAVGAAAGCVYIGLDPACLHGPLGAVDPRLKPIWMDHINEMQPLLGQVIAKHSEFAACTLPLIVLGAAAWVWLGWRKTGRTPAWLLLGAMLAAAIPFALSAERMVYYADWFALPLVAVALGELATRYWKSSPVPAVALAALFSQPALIAVVDAIPGWQRPDDSVKAAACTHIPAFRTLAGLPPGLALAEIDLGPYILAASRDAVMAAPYHRMTWGILAAHHALAAPPGEDERATRALGAAYVLDCPAQIAGFGHRDMGPQSLQLRLDRFAVPAWLEPLSARADPLQIYRVRPPAPAQ